MTKTTALVVLLVAAGGTWAQDYCKICSDHTMCIFPETGAKCSQLKIKGLSKHEISQVVVLHNKYRSKVANGRETSGINGAQPPAANMRKMEWDDELATVAQRWASQCSFGHDKCRDVARFEVGQNAYIFSVTSKDVPVDWSRPVASWYGEVKLCNKQNVAPFHFMKVSGHYTQMAWAESCRVGCGFALVRAGKWYRHLHVCNYGPTGNVLATKMYEPGEACSQCPPHAPLCHHGLCAEPDPPELDDNHS